MNLLINLLTQRHVKRIFLCETEKRVQKEKIKQLMKIN